MSRSTEGQPFTVPAGAWDTHVHIFDDPPPMMIHGEPIPFPHAPAAALDAMHAGIGIDHAVIVDGALGGPEMLIGQLARSGGRYAGVAWIDETVSDDVLARLADAGVRGARFYFVDFLGHPVHPDSFVRTAERIAKLGWHALIFAEPKDLLAHEAVLRAAPLPLVIDHLGHVPFDEGQHQPALELMLDLQSSRETYLKISCGDRRSRAGPPDYADAIPFTRRAIDNDPARVIWATDWPHVLYKDMNHLGCPPPDPRDLIALLFAYCRTQQEVDLILRDTPARLYG